MINNTKQFRGEDQTYLDPDYCKEQLDIQSYEKESLDLIMNSIREQEDLSLRLPFNPKNSNEQFKGMDKADWDYSVKKDMKAEMTITEPGKKQFECYLKNRADTQGDFEVIVEAYDLDGAVDLIYNNIDMDREIIRNNTRELTE